MPLLELPEANDLPIVEGPPTQVEPFGQALGGPHPRAVARSVARRAQRHPHPVRKLWRPRLLTPQVTGERAVEEMQKFLDVGESPAGSNCNVLTKRAGLGCVAWCDITVWTAWYNAGFNDGAGRVLMPGVKTDYWFGDAYVPNTMRHFQAAARFSATPVMGAAGIHFWGGGEGNSHIVMYVKDFGDGTVLNIEGNHNNVCEYVRRQKNDSTRRGYCLPVFAAAPVPVPTPAPIPEEDDVAKFITTDGEGAFVADGPTARWVTGYDDLMGLLNSGIVADKTVYGLPRVAFDSYQFVGKTPPKKGVVRRVSVAQTGRVIAAERELAYVDLAKAA